MKIDDTEHSQELSINCRWKIILVKFNDDVKLP